MLLDMIQIHRITRERIPMPRRINTPPPQLLRLLIRQIPMIPLIQHAIRKRASTPHTKQIALQPRPVTIDVKDRRARLVPAADHGTHGEPHAFVRVDEVGEELGGGGDGDAFFVAEFVQATVHAEVGFPVLAVGGTTGHGAQEVGVDLDDLLHRARSYEHRG